MTKIGKKLVAVLLALAMIVTFVPIMGAGTVYAADSITTVSLTYDTDIVIWDETKTEGDVMAAFQGHTSASPDGIRVDANYLVYKEGPDWIGIEDGTANINLRKDYALEYVLKLEDSSVRDWADSIKSLPNGGTVSIETVPGFSVSVNGSARTDAYLRYNSSSNYLYITVPLLGKPEIPPEVINSLELGYDTSVAVYMSSKTEGDIGAELRNSASLGGEGVKTESSYPQLMYRSGVSWSGIGDGSTSIDTTRQYGLQYAATPIAGYDWDEAIKSIPNGAVVSADEYSSFPISINGTERANVELSYNRSANMVFVYVPFFTAEAQPGTAVYTGSAIVPTTTASYNGTSWDDYTVSYKDKDNNTVTDMIAAGEYTIVLKGNGLFTGEITLPFTIERAPISAADITVSDMTYNGELQEPEPTLSYNGNPLVYDVDYNYSYSNNINAGTGVITLSGNGNFTDFTDKTFKIDPAPINGATVSGITAKTYTGRPITQAPVIKVGDTTLRSGTDYSVEYKNNTNAGTASVTITGIGNYTGTIEKTFTITAKKITPAVTLSTSAYTWNGKVKKPTVIVKAGSTKLAASQYTVTYKNNKNVGKASAVVTLKGNYSGSKTVYFKINPKGTSLSKVAKAKKAATVKWKKQSSKMSTSRITGYQILLATNSKFTKNKKTVTVKGYSKTAKKVTKLKGGKKYYVKIRTYKTVSGTKYYSPWSKVKTVTTKK